MACTQAGVKFRSLAEDFDTWRANGKLQLQMMLAFSEWSLLYRFRI